MRLPQFIDQYRRLTDNELGLVLRLMATMPIAAIARRFDVEPSVITANLRSIGVRV